MAAPARDSLCSSSFFQHVLAETIKFDRPSEHSSHLGLCSPLFDPIHLQIKHRPWEIILMQMWWNKLKINLNEMRLFMHAWDLKTLNKIHTKDSYQSSVDSNCSVLPNSLRWFQTFRSVRTYFLCSEMLNNIN